MAGFGSTLLAPGETTDFVLQFDASVEGTHAGVVSFDSNDADENPFDFNVSGVASTTSSVFVVDDGDAGYSATAGWMLSTGSGAQGDFDFAPVGTGLETATWTLGGLSAGDYRVSVTWEAFINRAIDVPYTVLDGVMELGTVAVDQTALPATFTDGGVPWEDLGVYTITGDTLNIQMSDLAGPPGSFVIADAVRIVAVGGQPLAPEIEVLVAGLDVADGTGSIVFGINGLDPPVTQTITVGNVGTADLSLGTLTLPAEFSLFAGFGSTLLAPGETTDFVVQFDAATPGTHSGVMSFDSNDADENPYDVLLVPEPGMIEQLAAGACALLALGRRSRGRSLAPTEGPDAG